MFCKLVLACALLVCNFAKAHMVFSNVIINGESTKTCVRPHPTSQFDYPISDKNLKLFETSQNMICGHAPALNPAQGKCPITAGSQIALQWWHTTPGDWVVDPSHKGPCMVYMARSDNGQGQVWFKVYEEGFNPSTGEFCVDRIRKDGPNKGQVIVTIPRDLPSGNYLLRTEFLALHEGFEEWGTQPYVGCAELTVTGLGGNADPPNKVAIPSGLYKRTDPGILFNIYYPSPVQSYPIPGPPVYVPGQISNPTPRPATPRPATQGPTTPGSTPAPSTPAPSTPAPSTPAPSTPAPSTPAPTPTPDGNSTCTAGTLSCQCASGRCSMGLRCMASVNICVYVECNVGSEGCPCTSGGFCDSSLKCLSKVCVNTTSLENDLSAIKDNDKSDGNSLVATLVTLLLLVAALAL